MFPAVLITPNWKQQIFIKSRMDEFWCIHIFEQYTATRNPLPHSVMWMNLRLECWAKVSPDSKGAYFVTPLTHISVLLLQVLSVVCLFWKEKTPFFLFCHKIVLFLIALSSTQRLLRSLGGPLPPHLWFRICPDCLCSLPRPGRWRSRGRTRRTSRGHKMPQKILLLVQHQVRVPGEAEANCLV